MHIFYKPINFSKVMDLRDRLRLTYEWIPECDRLLDLGCDRGDITILLTNKAKGSGRHHLLLLL